MKKLSYDQNMVRYIVTTIIIVYPHPLVDFWKA
jgi:hypothetical protein